jgi:cell division protein FtsI/penicillin-binding protein 2
MEDPVATANLLQELLGLKQSNLLASLKSERGFVWVAKGIDQELANTINERKIKGIYQVVETKRFYPNYETAAHAVGFVENGQGLDGIEFHYNTLLRGDEINRGELEALHFKSTSGFNQTGTHLVLTLDLMIQSKIERFLEKRIKITGAVSGAVLLMNANTGGVLAMASYPAFNPNRYWHFSSSALNNNVVTEPVYPGELALIFKQAAAINLSNEKKSQAIGKIDDEEPLLVIKPEILKRRKLSVAPQIDDVDPEYFARFTKLLGFDQDPVTDIPLKDETPISTATTLIDPSFNSSALRLLTGFTALMNNGRIVTPHLLLSAYPRKNPAPHMTLLTEHEQTASLQPDTSKDLIDFLAAKWLKINNRGRRSQMPMFFEAHRFTKTAGSSNNEQAVDNANLLIEQTPHITQSVMLGAIPGRNPKLTMVALLSYPDTSDNFYPDALESLGNKFALLSPDKDTIKKMLYVADQTPPVPSPDFWTDDGNVLAKSIDPLAPEKKDFAVEAADSYKNMPNVTGKSLRAGLQVLQHFNLDIKLVGSGRIVSQHPAAGTELKNGTDCILEMQQEI